jgi:hypothetical protein
VRQSGPDSQTSEMMLDQVSLARACATGGVSPETMLELARLTRSMCGSGSAVAMHQALRRAESRRIRKTAEPMRVYLRTASRCGQSARRIASVRPRRRGAGRPSSRRRASSRSPGGDSDSGEPEPAEGREQSALLKRGALADLDLNREPAV